MKRLSALLLCLCLLLTGCAAGDAGYVPTGDGLSYDEDYTGPQATVEVPDEEQKLTLTYYPNESFNPYRCTDYTNRALFSLLYQSLFTVDRDYVVEPQLCKHFTMTEDMTCYTFYLERASFSDGSFLTADDVLASLNAAKESPFFGGRFFHVKEMTKSADGGVTIQLDTAYEDFPLLLDIPIVKAAQIAEDRPMGTGPYVLHSSASGDSLRKRVSWWCQPKMAVTAPTIPLFPAESTIHIRDQFQFYDLSLVCADPGSDRYADYRCDYELWDIENGIFMYLATCSNSEVFSNDEVRSALTYAIDRDTIVESYYRGFARSTTLPVSPLSPHYSQVLAERYAYNGVKFAQAVKDAGLVGSEVLFVVNKDDSLRLRVARDIAQMLEDCGLEVELQELSSHKYSEALKSWNFDIYLGQTKLSANMDLSAFFHPYGDLSWGGVNDVTAYTQCLQALENHGNYYTLHKTVMDNGLICPVLFRSYAVYATRGLLTELTPSRDNVFYYSMGRSLENAKTILKPQPTPTE